MTPIQKLRQQIIEQVLQFQGGPLGPISPDAVIEAADKYLDWIMNTASA